MSSRFFMSDSDSDSSTDSERFEKEPVGTSTGISAFIFSDDEEDKKRVVRSAKEKRYEEINNIIKNTKNFRKNKDMASLLGGFEDLCKAYQKALPVVMKEEGGKTPRFYLRCLVELETFLNQTWEDKDIRKMLSKNNSKSLTTMRQKYRKYIREFEQDILVFKENPDEDSESDSEEAEDEEPSDDEAIEDFKKEPSLPKEDKNKLDFGLSDDDSSDWPSDSDESSSAEEEKKPGQLITRDHFLKKPEAAEKQKDVKKEKPDRIRSRREQKEESDDEEGWQKVHKHAMPVEKPKMFAKDDEITVAAVIKKLHEVMAARGKKGTDRREQIELLNELRKISEEKDLGNGILIKIRINNIMSVYDYSVSVFDPMKAELWDKVLLEIDALLDLLRLTPDLSIGDHITEEAEYLDKPPYRVRGCILTIVDRMDEEFIKFLKAADAHSNDYVNRLRDEIQICQIVNKLLQYIEDTGMPADKCGIYLRKIEHLYYKYDDKAAQQVRGEIPATEVTSTTEMDKLCKYICVTDTTDRLRTRAVLCRIYHLSLHDKWYEARDLLLMSHLQDTIQFSDLPTQILYNRTMVQLGLCAFRHGNIRESHNALLDIQSGGRAKELLAQGLIPQRQHERTSEQEKMEKQRQIPFHQHINLEMLECVYLVSAMLIEIPYMAAHEFDARRRLISKSFHHQLKNSERQALVGPPESMREHVVAASKAMRNGNWESCRNLLLNQKMRTRVWDLFHNTETVTAMLDKKIREESLRTYLFTYSYVYDSISLVTLTDTFSLPYGSVHAVISKMIINEEIMASLDEPTSCLVMHRTEPSSMQSLSLQLADKMYNLVDNNEKLLDQRPFFNRNTQGGNYRQKSGWSDRRDRRN